MVDENDKDFQQGKHSRKRPKRIKLEFDVDELRSSHSTLADRHLQSSNARSATLTNLVQKGGGNLYDLPCSPSTMIR